MRTKILSLAGLLSLNALAALSACSGPTVAPGQFEYAVPARGTPSDSPVAVGANVPLKAVMFGGPAVVKVTSSDPTVLSVGAVGGATNASAEEQDYGFSATAGKAATVTLAAYDESGAKVIEGALSVAAPASVAVFSAGGDATVLAGQSYAFTVDETDTTGDALALAGPFHVAYAGVLRGGSPVVPSYNTLTANYFVEPETAGDGQITVSFPSDPVSSFVVHALLPSSIDTISLSQSSVALSAGGTDTIGFSLRSAGTLAQGDGTACTSADPSVATVALYGSSDELVGLDTGALVVTGVKAGTTTVTCAINGVEQGIGVTVE